MKRIYYVNLGWHLIPYNYPVNGGCSCYLGQECKSPGKHPAVKSLAEWLTRETTPTDIKAWLKQDKRYNWGIITGKASKVIVLDCDQKPAIQLVWQIINDTVTPAPICQTARGCHFYFAYEELTTAKSAIPGLEIKSNGMPVNVPPSLHKSGWKYQWMDGFSPEIIPEPYPMPKELKSAILAKPEPRQPHNESPSWVAEALKGVGENERNATATKLAGYFKTKGLQEYETLEILRGFAQHCYPPMAEKELEQTVMKSFRKWPSETSNWTDRWQA